jgi:hypothetical protein
MHAVCIYLYPELRHLRQETSDTVVTPSIPDMTLAVVELNDSAKRVSFISAILLPWLGRTVKYPGISHDALLKNKLYVTPADLYRMCKFYKDPRISFCL